MDQRTRRLLLTVVAVGAGTAPALASAQVGPGPAGAIASPYNNPYMNPFLNPALMAGPSAVRPGDAALYFFAAQQSRGGIGSGQLSGTRAPRGTPATTTAAPAQRDAANSSMVPGGNASRYFSRAYQPAASAEKFYNRQGRFFPKSGR